MVVKKYTSNDPAEEGVLRYEWTQYMYPVAGFSDKDLRLVVDQQDEEKMIRSAKRKYEYCNV